MRMAPLALALLAVSVSMAAGAAPPEPFSAKYLLSAKGIVVGKTRWSFERAGDARFVYEARSTPTGLVSLFRDDRIVERSELRVRPTGELRPLRYHYRRTGDKAEQVEIRFDWENRIAHNDVEGTTRRLDIPEGTLDKASYILALMRDLARGKRRVSYPVAAHGKLKTYRLEAVERERLDTKLGQLDTIKVRRIRDPDTDRKTLAWFAPALGYLPVKIVHEEDDGWGLSLHIESAQAPGDAVARRPRSR